ncbi:transposase [Chryseobacterium caseinilyticum]|uniref:Transposase n=1 Tax=Chryseobacterium caseinilyticum TaxID=2771428 RepID=A0ABR8Z9J7_9FLAO|nr:transposase [Chryseobacterium caseinilyticum]MBD8081625.1 transposase [Chryseobacterium caseinilyticum]
MTSNFKTIHIGTFIKKRVDELNLDSERLSKILNTSEDEVEKIYSSINIHAELMLKLSKYLKYDFFRIYSQHLLLYSPSSKSEKSSALPQFKKNIYTKEIIDYVVELIQTERKSMPEIVEEYRIPKSTLFRWMTKYKKEN